MRVTGYTFLLAALLLVLPSMLLGQDENRSSGSQPPAYKSYENFQAAKMAVGDTNNNGALEPADLPANKGDLIVTGNMGVGTNNPTQRLEVNGYLKASDGVCIGNSCKNKWPSLKCAEYDSRPKGENGDDYCSSMGKTCFGVSIGSGASYFGECSTPPATAHRTRCCWVE